MTEEKSTRAYYNLCKSLNMGVKEPTQEWLMSFATGRIERLAAEIKRSQTVVDRLRTAELSQTAWEGNADIVLLNDAPIGGTITKHPREFDRWWPAVNISYQIAKRIITLKFISLVNLILDKEVVKELIQEDFNKQNLKVALTNILELSNRENIFLNYFDLEKQLGGKGASKNVASQIVAALK